ncbi:hypothetical protein [Microvirga makkahensis]|uniref:hypothetical protein n=1 Tax=Microvirga makkahensis TaxID=1128670 RepID=UPI00197C3A18|nr:hypothetical protein [Microvirga makkahensis]
MAIQPATHSVPTGLKLGYAVATPVIGAVYWQRYGPRNFLWVSDLALASTALSVITENRLLASMPAVGVLCLEFAWNADFLTRGRLLGLAGYMFDRRMPLGLRALSLFHVALPPTLLWMLRRFGYDPRALPAQTALTWATLSASYILTKPEENINWVYGPGRKPQRIVAPLLYLCLEMIALPVAVFLPMHFLLKRLFPQRQTVHRAGTTRERSGFREYPHTKRSACTRLGGSHDRET